MKLAKGLFILGAFLFPLGIYIAGFSPLGILLSVIGGGFILLDARILLG
ncbi:hypothetical protein [Niallia sp. 01092]